METKFYILYKTTNLKNNKFYIGVHETFNLEDGYLGSGKKFKNSLNYHGKENFKREILEYFNDSKSMYSREREIVNEELLKNRKCLNIGLGGKCAHRGFISKEHQLKCQRAAANSTNKKRWSDNRESNVEKLKGRLKGNTYAMGSNSFTGKVHSDETRKKMSNTKKKNGAQKGKRNSQYGTSWITKDTQNKKIQKTDLDNWIVLGWISGRYRSTEICNRISKSMKLK